MAETKLIPRNKKLPRDAYMVTMEVKRVHPVKMLFRDVFIGMILVVVLPTTALGVIASGHLNLLNMAGALFLMAVLQFMPNVLNNHVDWHADEINQKRLHMHKVLSRRSLLLITLVLFLITLPFFLFGSLYMKITMLIAYFMIINYNILIKAKDVVFLNYAFIALYYGPLAYAVGFFLSGASIQSFTNLIWIPIFLFFVDLGFSVSKDYPDIDGDKQHGKMTLPVVFGKNFSIAYQLCVITGVFAFAIIYTYMNFVFEVPIAFFILYLIALYSINASRTTTERLKYHMAHNLIRSNALLTRCALIALFLLLGYYSIY